MADIEMLGGSGFHMDHSEEGAAQMRGHDGQIEMLGGSDFHMTHSPIGSAQKRDGMKGVDMIGTQGLIEAENVSAWGNTDKPKDYGTE